MKYDNRNRADNYIFTVRNCPAAELLFDRIRKQNRALKSQFTLQRFGRLRDRKSRGISRQHGHVKMDKADRWDLYLRLNNRSYRTVYEDVQAHVIILLKNSGVSIREFLPFIEYVNGFYKLTFEQILESKTFDLSKVQISPEAVKMTRSVLNKVMKTTPTTTWKVTLTGEMTILGDTVYALESAVKEIPNLTDPKIVNYEKLDPHRDLPLVQFEYPDSERGYGTKTRNIRVTKMDGEYLEGFDGNQFKKFCVNRIVGAVQLFEIPVKS